VGSISVFDQHKMGVLEILENLKENKWGGQINSFGGNSVSRQIVQSNVNIVQMNKDIVDMSKELMKINWTHGFNLKEEKSFLTNTMKNTEYFNNTCINTNTQKDEVNNRGLDIDSDVINMNKDILQMNKDILEINKGFMIKRQSNESNSSINKKIKNSYQIKKKEKLDNHEKENRDPKQVNKEETPIVKHIVKQNFQNKNFQESCEREQLESRIYEKRTRDSSQELRNEIKVEANTENTKRDINKDVEIILRTTNNAKNSLMDMVKDDNDGDMYIVNTDNELTDIIKKTFETHGCEVSVTQLEKDLIALFILLNKKISIKKLKKLIEKGKRFGLEFFLTKTGMTSSLLTKVHQIFKW